MNSSLFDRDPARLSGVGAGLMTAGGACTVACIALSRRARGGAPLSGEIAGLAVDDVVVIGLALLGSVLMGASIVFNVAGLRARRRKS
jgi:hypothetical protein